VREVRVFVRHDPEIADLSYLVWEIDVPDHDLENYSELCRQWGSLFVEICPRYRQVDVAQCIIPVK